MASVHGPSEIRHPKLVAGLAAGPLAWFLDLNVRYFFAEARRTELVAYVVASASATVAVGAAAFCLAYSRRFSPHDTDSGERTRHFVALGGSVLNAFFALLILGALLSNLFFGVGD